MSARFAPRIGFSVGCNSITSDLYVAAPGIEVHPQVAAAHGGHFLGAQFFDNGQVFDLEGLHGCSPKWVGLAWLLRAFRGLARPIAENVPDAAGCPGVKIK